MANVAPSRSSDSPVQKTRQWHAEPVGSPEYISNDEDLDDRISAAEDDDDDNLTVNSIGVQSTANTSSNAGRNSSGKQADNDSEGDSPASLVRTEDRAVSVLRIVAILLLLFAAVAAGALTYLYTARAEREAFDSAFDDISDKIVDSFLEETLKKFWHARSLAAGIHGVMKAGGVDKTSMSIDTWEQMTEEARLVSNVQVVAWSPFLYDQAELDAFWKFAIEETGGGIPTSGPHPICDICGNPDYVVLNPDEQLTFDGFGTFSCNDLLGIGRAGIVSICQVILDATDGICECGLPPGNDPIIPTRNTTQGVWMIGSDGLAVDDTTSPPWNPIWQIAASGTFGTTFLYNQMSEEVRRRTLSHAIEHRVAALTEVYSREGDYYQNYAKGDIGEPATILVYPVFELDSEEVMAGSITMEMLWRTFIPSNFPIDGDLVDIVISNSCGQNYTFRINPETEELDLIGEGDLHDKRFESYVHASDFDAYNGIVRSASGTNPGDDELVEFCSFRFLVFPRQELEDEYVTDQPLVFTIVVCAVFVFTTAVFFLYDFFVRRRQRLVMDRATRTGAIVSSLFPETVRDRLYNTANTSSMVKIGSSDDPESVLATGKNGGGSGSGLKAPRAHIKSFLSSKTPQFLESEPIADLFPQTTIMFIDISGFTAWSSERDPSQVFRLLESIYQTFDEIAKRRNIFKVETIGDSYVAAAGLPEPRTDHALAIVRFSYECLKEMRSLVKRLEVLLGPSTGDLRARCGVHSGPVTAGVLRGAKARFQLFGDTMNVAARLESTGKEGRIHISRETADILKNSGKATWVTPRQELVVVKGKGEMQTYWANPKGRHGTGAGLGSGTQSETMSEADSTGFGDLSGSPVDALDVDSKVQRLIDWNVQVLFGLLEEVVRKRGPTKSKADSRSAIRVAEREILSSPGIVLDEITEVVNLPAFQDDPSDRVDNDVDVSVRLDKRVRDELTAFVSRLSAHYHDVPFHNFEHASHVTMSAGKLMRRIVVPDGIDYDEESSDLAKKVHGMTYGISSDPLMQFAIVFAAVIHDVDHTGLPNAELVRMQTPAAQTYRGKSVAEQNSVDVAWKTLMSGEFDNLRSCIYSTVRELKRFRQLVVNAVMATDIADKELQAQRRERWARAFSTSSKVSIPERMAVAAADRLADRSSTGSSSSSSSDELSDSDNMDRRATIVFEYIIQASDVAHTMQHWHTYQKWNERLFFERYRAYLDGHEKEDPSVGWYKGEIGFFDFYIIPLAKKLKECGVFGVSHHEYLAYALGNRAEWEKKGKEIVRRMHSAAVSKFGMGTLKE